MKTIITTIAAALLITLSFDASAQDSKTKQQPVKKETKSKAATTTPTESKSKANTTTQTESKSKTATAAPNTGTPQPNTTSQPEGKGKTGTAALPMLKKKQVKRTMVPAPQKQAEPAPAKKID